LMVTVCKRFGLDSTFWDWCFSSHEIVKTARKKASKVCWQSLTETFRENPVKELAANIMQEIGNRCLLACTCGGDYPGVNGRQDAIITSRHRKQWQLCGIWQNVLRWNRHAAFILWHGSQPFRFELLLASNYSKGSGSGVQELTFNGFGSFSCALDVNCGARRTVASHPR
jgi:hypothetical protein